MRPARHVYALNGYMHKNLKTNKRPNCPTKFHTKFANESRQRCSRTRTDSYVAPYKPTTTNPPFRPQNYFRPLQTICQEVNHAMNGTGYKLCTPSAKATDFKITLSAGVKEDKERVSFLEQQIQQAKDSYESSLKTVIEECIALEIQAAIT